jgi:hypothetical protein
MVTLSCSAHDFYSYNYQSKSFKKYFNDKCKYLGERSHFNVNVTEPGIKTFECSDDTKCIIIMSPNGRVIYNKNYKTDKGIIKWHAKEVGIYLFKIWSGQIEDLYNVTWTGVNFAEQQIYSGGMSNSDGSLFDKGLDITRKNGVFKGSPKTRYDRVKTNNR